ncbi:MAG: ATP-grasp domain-containing protein [Solirubrobacteraceae bacterium]
MSTTMTPPRPLRAPMAGMRVAFLLQGAPREHRVWSAVGHRLAQRGALVDFRFPEAELHDLSHVRVEHDLYVLKATSGLGLSLAGALHAAGAAILNPYPVAALCRDKILTSHALAAAGVAAPDTWVCEDRDRLRALLDGGPIVVKPHQGSRGVGVHVVHTERELDALPLDGGLLFAQRYHAPDGDRLDNKMYCIDGELFGVRRVWPSRSWADKLGRPFEPGDELRRIARGCAAAIGADTFGFDVVFSSGEPYVVDVSGLPGFKGVPDGETRLAAAIERAALRVRAGAPIVRGAER